VSARIVFIAGTVGVLPIAGHPVRLVVMARRFYCAAVLCGRRIFAERFDSSLLAPWARRTSRLDHIVHHLGLALGGRPAANFARRLMLPVSNDTLLRVVRRRGTPRFLPPTVVGVDDWAWKRNQRYGTIICDLERRKTIALLPDREPATTQLWLSDQPRRETEIDAECCDHRRLVSVSPILLQTRGINLSKLLRHINLTWLGPDERRSRQRAPCQYNDGVRFHSFKSS
jgi:hypothetical protein